MLEPPNGKDYKRRLDNWAHPLIFEIWNKKDRKKGVFKFGDQAKHNSRAL